MATTRATGFKVTAAIWNALFTNISDTGELGPAWTAVPFNAANFTASDSMTWTVASGDVSASRYVVNGKTLIWNVALETTTIGGTPSTVLQLTIPGGEIGVNASHYVRLARCINNGSLVEAYARLTGATTLGVLKTDHSNWATGTDNNSLFFQIEVEIQ